MAYLTEIIKEFLIYVMKDIIVKSAKIDNQEMHGKNAKFLYLLIIPCSGLFSSGKYFCRFYHYSPVTKKKNFLCCGWCGFNNCDKYNSNEYFHMY